MTTLDELRQAVDVLHRAATNAAPRDRVDLHAASLVLERLAVPLINERIRRRAEVKSLEPDAQ
jgi:hypothetical protein